MCACVYDIMPLSCSARYFYNTEFVGIPPLTAALSTPCIDISHRRRRRYTVFLCLFFSPVHIIRQKYFRRATQRQAPCSECKIQKSYIARAPFERRKLPRFRTPKNRETQFPLNTGRFDCRSRLQFLLDVVRGWGEG